MDKLSGLAEKATGGKSDNKTAAGGSSDTSSSKKDYLDKGIESVEQRVAGDKFNADKMQSTNEKITGTIKDKFKSTTGHDLPGTTSTQK